MYYQNFNENGNCKYPKKTFDAEFLFARMEDLEDYEEFAAIAEIPGNVRSDRADPLTDLTDAELVQRYRLSRPCIISLLESMRARLPRIETERGE